MLLNRNYRNRLCFVRVDGSRRYIVITTSHLSSLFLFYLLLIQHRMIGTIRDEKKSNIRIVQYFSLNLQRVFHSNSRVNTFSVCYQYAPVDIHYKSDNFLNIFITNGTTHHSFLTNQCFMVNILQPLKNNLYKFKSQEIILYKSH